MKLNGDILDADGHVIERDAELFEHLEAPYSGHGMMLAFPFFPPIDGFIAALSTPAWDIIGRTTASPRRPGWTFWTGPG